MKNKEIKEIDVEAELARILQEEIWKEITATTGLTQQDLNDEMIAKIIADMKLLAEAEFYNNVYDEND